jgi:hypothetical protein
MVLGSAKRCSENAEGTAASAVIISSQPTRLSGFLDRIKAAVKEKTTGMAQDQPNACNCSGIEGGISRVRYQFTSPQVDKPKIKRLRAQAKTVVRFFIQKKYLYFSLLFGTVFQSDK